MEKRWIELKNEVAYLDRKRRRARRKEREGSVLSLSFEPAEVTVLTWHYTPFDYKPPLTICINLLQRYIYLQYTPPSAILG